MDIQNSAIAVTGLTVRYNNRVALDDITFSVAKGAYLGLVGPNGSGKSTLIKAMLGLTPSAAGEVYFSGQKRAGFGEWPRIGYLPQKISHFNPYFPATVGEVVALGLLSRKMERAAENAAVEDALGLLDIGGIKEKLIGELSGGQLQRVLLARAIAGRPAILLLDEPTTALDPETRERFYSTLESINRDLKTTVVLVTHDIGTIGKYASQMLYLDKKVVFHGGFNDFCGSGDMKKYFGEYSQHVICHRHD